MKKTNLLLLLFSLAFSSLIFGQASLNCYPASEDYNTGSTNGTVFTQTSMIRTQASTEVGWARFDISGIPEGATVQSVELHAYVSLDNYAYFYTMPVDDDPLLGDAASVYADVIAGSASSKYTSWTSNFPDPGWYVADLGATALADLIDNIADGWFGVGFYEYEGGTTYYFEFDGWNETNPPYITVTYLLAGAPLPVENPYPADGAVPVAVDASLTWDFGADTETYDLYFGTEFPPSTLVVDGAASDVSGSYDPGTMEFNTEYFWQVVSKNAGFETPGPVWSFTTACGAFDVPFTEDFESVTTPYLPNCWTGYLETTNQYAYVRTAQYSGVDGSQYLQMDNSGDASATLMFISPEVAGGLAGKYINFFFRGWMPNLLVGTMSDPSDPSTFVTYQTIAVVDQYTYQEAEVFFTDYTGTDTYFAFQPDITGSYQTCYIDNILVDVAPTCPKPADLYSSDPTTTSIMLGWTENGDATAWNIEYGEFGFEPTGVANATASTNPFELTGLDAGMKYDFYVQSDCGDGDVSFWVGPAQFITYCLPTDVPISEDFETATPPELPVCWGSFINSTNQYASVQTQSYSGNNEPYSVRLGNSGDAAATLILIAPQLNGGLSGKYINFYVFGYAPELIIGTMTDPMDDATFTEFSVLSITNTYQEFEVFFDTYVGTDEYIAFKGGFTGSYQDIYIDDILIDFSPACPKPGELMATDPTTTSVMLSWLENGDAAEWNIEYGEAGFEPTGEATVVADSNPFELTGLMSGTAYDFYVQSNCGDEVSYWVGPASFNTLCEAFMIPYTEDFESVTPPTVPQCIFVENVDGDTKFWYTSTTLPHTGLNSIRIDYTYNNDMDDWFFSAPLELTGGVEYMVDFYYTNNSTTYVEKLEVMWGDGPSSADMTGGQIFNDDNMQYGSIYQNGVAYFTPAEDGVYFVGWHGYSVLGQYYMYVDDITIDAVPPLPTPTGLMATVDGSDVNLTWEGPEGATGYNVYRDDEYLASTTDLFYDDMGLAEGTYEYYVTALFDAEESGPSNTVSATIEPEGIYTQVVYPMMSDYWTGSTDGATKTETSLINGLGDAEKGWAKFDVSSIPMGATIESITFWGYVSDANWPYWRITPLASDPESADASTLFDEIVAGEDDAVAYSINNESSSFGPGWHSYTLMGTANADLEAALAQGWFACGIGDTDPGVTYYLILDGWNEANMPYLEVTYAGGASSDCENFDDLTAGDYVAGQLGGYWTTWGENPGGADDAFVSDVYSNSPSNSFVIDDGAIDLIFQFGDEALATGGYYYSHYIYVPTGYSGYFNVQADPTPGVAWVLDLFFDDGGTGSFGTSSTETFTYAQDTWIMVQINFDLDNDLAQVYFDGEMITEFAWDGTIGGIDYYGYDVGGAPGAYYDDVCFGPYNPGSDLNPPLNLTADVNLYNVELNWDAPEGTGSDYIEIAYDDGTGEQSWWISGNPTSPDDMMAKRMTMPEDGTLQEVAFFTRTGTTGAFNFNDVMVCPDDGAGTPDLANAYENFGVQVIENTVMEWRMFVLTAPLDMVSGEDFWIVANWEGGNTDGPFIGGDNTAPPAENRNYWSNVPGVWNLFTTSNFMMRGYYLPAGKSYTGSGLQIIPSTNPRFLQIPVSTTVNPVMADGTQSWKAPTIITGVKEFVGYNVYRDGEMIDYTTSESYTDMGLDPGMYDYYVTAVYDEGESDPSNTVSVEVIEIVSADCANFDDLTVGGYVAEQLGGLWTTWGNNPGSAEDAIVSDAYSVSPSNSALVEGTTDLVQLFGTSNLTAGVYQYSFNIYVPTGKTGYFNLQKDIVPGTEWGFQVMFEDDGLQYIDGAAAAAVLLPFEYDTWINCVMIVDLDMDWMQYYVDGELIHEYQWTLGTFGNAGALTLGGANFYANPGATGTLPGAHFDDVCLESFTAEPCDNFDDLTVGGFVAEQLGGLWNTWSGNPGGADDAIVSDDYSNSPDNSFVVNSGSVDLIREFGSNPISSGAWLYEHFMYVPAGFSGYFNVQSDPTPGVAWVIELYFDDGGTGSFIVSGTTTEFEYTQDTWFWVGINFDLDDGLAEVWFDDNIVHAFATDNTIGGIDYYGSTSGGTPSGYYDDVCFGEGYNIVGFVDNVASSLQIFPNPASYEVNIKSDAEIQNVIVYNFSGQKVVEEKVSNTSYSVDVSNFNRGVYIFQIDTEEGRIVERIIVQ